MDANDQALIEAKVTDNRALFLKLRERKGMKVNPFVLGMSIFFAMLVTFVIMMFIVVFLFLKQAFSGLTTIS